LPPYLKNKYSIALIAFFVWIMFFDHNRIINQVKLLNTINNMEDEKAYYMEEIIKDSTTLHTLESNKDELERFAREKYLMKKDNEDVYLVIDEE